ncbi:MAG: hypothetical protein J3R72DRAFT_87837 [Linnemannia gamsii]|nr:MAG: hypothetical protein J3R72DRAFT_87837 [Linnemannia gamsii]
MTSTRPREGRGVRNAAGGEHDRLKRAVLQPVQCWDKKWAESKNGKQLQVFKWVKCKAGSGDNILEPELGSILSSRRHISGTMMSTSMIADILAVPGMNTLAHTTPVRPFLSLWRAYC